MTNRIRELALELLLLRERYSSEEIAALRRTRLSDELGELLTALESVAALLPPKKRRTLTHTEDAKKITEEKISAIKENFIATLSDNKMPNRSTELASIAKRLRITSQFYDDDALVYEISKRLRRMPATQAEIFFNRLKPSQLPDEGYIGLANFILRREENSE